MQGPIINRQWQLIELGEGAGQDNGLVLLLYNGVEVYRGRDITEAAKIMRNLVYGY